MTSSKPTTAVPAQAPRPTRWLLFVHVIPASASKVRVRAWRRLQQIGAIAVKQAVYVLPDTAAARESFEWLKADLEGAGGEATIFSADAVDTWSDDGLIEAFRRARQGDYAALREEVATVVKRVEGAPPRARTRLPDPARLLERYRQRLAAIERVDHFGSVGRDEVLGLLARLQQHLESQRRSGPGAVVHSESRDAYTARLWVTRPRPGVDRMASAWLIRSFIDPKARFAFAANREALTADAVPYDMYGVRFTHHNGGCTFETLCAFFQVRDAAVDRLAPIVHALDLEDAEALPADAATMQSLIDGLQLTYSDDDALLVQGMVLFDALYRTFARQARATPQVGRTAKKSRRPSTGGRVRKPKSK
jgi:hypothetical protein